MLRLTKQAAARRLHKLASVAKLVKYDRAMRKLAEGIGWMKGAPNQHDPRYSGSVSRPQPAPPAPPAPGGSMEWMGKVPPMQPTLSGPTPGMRQPQTAYPPNPDPLAHEATHAPDWARNVQWPQPTLSGPNPNMRRPQPPYRQPSSAEYGKPRDPRDWADKVQWPQPTISEPARRYPPKGSYDVTSPPATRDSMGEALRRSDFLNQRHANQR